METDPGEGHSGLGGVSLDTEERLVRQRRASVTPDSQRAKEVPPDLFLAPPHNIIAPPAFGKTGSDSEPVMSTAQGRNNSCNGMSKPNLLTGVSAGLPSPEARDDNSTNDCAHLALQQGSSGGMSSVDTMS